MDAEHNTPFQLLFIGTSNVDLCSEQNFTDLKNATSFKKSIGGFAAKVAIGCARLGMNTTLVSARGQDRFGEYLIESLEREGIQTQFKEFTGKPTTITFRAKENHSHEQALSCQAQYQPLSAQDLDQKAFQSASAIVLFASNFYQSIYAQISLDAIKMAKQQKKAIWLMMDTLKKEGVEELNHSVIAECDLIIGGCQQWQTLTDQHQMQSALTQIRSKTKATLIVMNDNYCTFYTDDIHTPWDKEKFTTKIKNFPPFNGHDTAWIAGFLAGFAQSMPHTQCFEMAFACQMIASHRADLSEDLPSAQELAFFLSDHEQVTVDTLNSSYFSHIHYATTHEQHHLPLCLFNFGYHQHWVKGLANICKQESVLLHAKSLVAQGIAKVSDFDMSGIELDDKENSAMIELFPRDKGYIVRPVEVPMSIPMQFNTDIDICSLLHSWPSHHIAKATMIYHTDDRFVLREAQEAKLHLLYRACRAQKRPFIVDIMPPSRNLITASTFAHIIKHFYEIGIYADWWQIPHQLNARSYDNISEVIQDHDPYCQGFIVNLTQATSTQLKLLFDTVANHHRCAGFVTGRMLIQPALESWFKQKMSDEALIESVAHQFRKAVQLWEEMLHAGAAAIPQEKRA